MQSRHYCQLPSYRPWKGGRRARTPTRGSRSYIKGAIAAFRNAELWAAVMVQDGLTVEQLAEAQDVSKSTVARILKLNRLPEELKTALREEHREVAGWSVADALGHVAKTPQR